MKTKMYPTNLAACAVVAIMAFGCGGDSTGVPAGAVTVALRSPAADMQAEAGTPLRIDYMDTSEVGGATTNLYADVDGDLATTNDQVVIAADRPVRHGMEQTVLWDTSDVPPGVYVVVAMTTDWRNGITASDVAQGTVTIVPSAATFGHLDVVLKDRWGDPLTVDSTEPYSPRNTCGGCHCIDDIANGYHFQQGRTDHRGRIAMKDDFFADGRQWLKSAGMYGKW